MAEGTVQVAPDSTGKKIRTQEVTEGLNTVEQQVVTIAKADGTLVDPTTVSVSNFPATQPVSGSVSVGNFPATQPVTGTFWQATQPVSATSLPLPAGAALDSSLTTIDTDVKALTKPADQQHAIVDSMTPPALTKGTQGSTGFSTQDLKDAGRTFVVISADRVAGATSEALISFSKNVGGTVTTGQTTYTVTTGKTLRCQIFQIEILNTTTVANRSIQRLRGVLSGTANATSPVLLQAVAPASSAVATGAGQETFMVPDGLELPSGASIGISHLENVTTAGIVSTLLVGYEY